MLLRSLRSRRRDWGSIDRKSTVSRVVVTHLIALSILQFRMLYPNTTGLLSFYLAIRLKHDHLNDEPR